MTIDYLFYDLFLCLVVLSVLSHKVQGIQGIEILTERLNDTGKPGIDFLTIAGDNYYPKKVILGNVCTSFLNF